MFTHWLASSLADTQQMSTLGVHVPKHFIVKCEQKETEANVRVFAWHVWDWIPFSELEKKQESLPIMKGTCKIPCNFLKSNKDLENNPHYTFGWKA